MNDAPSTPLRLLIASAHAIIHEGLRVMLSSSPGIQLLGTATSLPETIRLVGELRPHVLLVDLHIHPHATLKTLTMIRGEWPQIAIVGLTQHESDTIHLIEHLRAGLAVCLPLHAKRATILRALHAARRGETLLQSATLHHLLRHSHEPLSQINRPLAETQKERASLTERELTVLRRVACGERNKEIAASMGISEPTVKTHLANIYFKLGVDSRASAVAVAMEHGLLTPHRSYSEQE